MKNKFITIEGIDLCGKSTQIKMLTKRFEENNIPVWVTNEPTGGRIGKMIREDYLSGKVEVRDRLLIDSLFIADRIDHITGEDGIKTHLNNGDNVLCDRYIVSGIAYSAANLLLSGKVKNIEDGVVRAVSYNKIAGDILMPDINIILSIEPSEALKRLTNRDNVEIYENIEFQSIVNNAIDLSINLLKHLYPDCKFVYIDANDNVDNVLENIWNEIK